MFQVTPDYDDDGIKLSMVNGVGGGGSGGEILDISRSENQFSNHEFSNLTCGTFH